MWIFNPIQAFKKVFIRVYLANFAALLSKRRVLALVVQFKHYEDVELEVGLIHWSHNVFELS